MSRQISMLVNTDMVMLFEHNRLGICLHSPLETKRIRIVRNKYCIPIKLFQKKCVNTSVSSIWTEIVN